MDGDLVDLVHSLGFHFKSCIDDKHRQVLAGISKELEIDRKKALNALFSSILHDDMIVTKTHMT